MKKITSIIIAAMLSFHLCAAFEFVNAKADWSGNVKEGSIQPIEIVKLFAYFIEG